MKIFKLRNWIVSSWEHRKFQELSTQLRAWAISRVLSLKIFKFSAWKFSSSQLENFQVLRFWEILVHILCTTCWQLISNLDFEEASAFWSLSVTSSLLHQPKYKGQSVSIAFIQSLNIFMLTTGDKKFFRIFLKFSKFFNFKEFFNFQTFFNFNIFLNFKNFLKFKQFLKFSHGN